MHDVRDACGGGGLADRFCAGSVHGLEILAAVFRQHADEIDHGVRVAKRGGDRIRIAQIGLHRRHLTDAAQRLQEEGEVGTPAGDAHAPPAIGQFPDDMAADEARSAEHSHQPIAHKIVAH